MAKKLNNVVRTTSASGENNTPRKLKNVTVNDSAVYGIRKTAEDSYKKLQEYSNRRSNNEYISAAELAGYRKARTDYTSATRKLNDMTRAQGGSIDYKADVDRYDWLDSLDKSMADDEKTFANFKNADAYKNAVAEYEAEAPYRQKYEGMSYSELMKYREIDTDAKQWIDAYAPSVMTSEDYSKEIYNIDNEIAALNNVLSQYEEMSRRAKNVGYSDYSESWMREFGANYGSTKEIENKIESLKAKKWDYENAIKFGSLGENEDYNAKAAFDPSLAANMDGYYNSVAKEYKKRNGIKDKNGVTVVGSDLERNYDQLKDDEINNFFYLYNTGRIEEAHEYIDSLAIELSRRQTEENNKRTKELTEKLPVLSDIASVPASLMGGVGAVDVALQKVIKDVTEARTGEYAGPINYYNNAMRFSNAAATIRETRSNQLADKFGTIKLDSDKNPILSRVLNGKSWGDVYQLGMSMADSAAVAVLAPYIGSGAATTLLAGNAATQGVVDAVERGATDEQALMMGALNGAFEWLFEKYEIDTLLGESDSFIKSFVKNALVEGFGESATSISNFAADTIVMANNSDLEKRIAAYMEDGLSRNEAENQALIDKAIEIGWDGIGGLLSGGVMGGGTYAVSSAIKSKNTTDVKKFIGKSVRSDNAGMPSLIAAAEIMTDNEDVSKALETVKKKNTDLNVGELAVKVDEILAKEFDTAETIEELDIIREKYGTDNIFATDNYAQAYEKLTGDKYVPKVTATPEVKTAEGNTATELQSNATENKAVAIKGSESTYGATTTEGANIEVYNFTDDGKLKTSEGVKDIGEVNFKDRGVAQLFNNASEYDGKVAAVYVAAYTPGTDIGAYNLAFMGLFGEGQTFNTGKDFNAAFDTYGKIGNIDYEAAQLIYDMGGDYARAKKAQANKKAVTPKGITGEVTESTEGSLTERERAIYNTIAKEFKVDIDVVSMTGDGSLGYANTVTRRIVSSLSSGNNISTLLHESGHIMKAWAKETYNEIQDAVVSWYSKLKNNPLDKLIEARQNAYAEKGEVLSPEEALDEVTNNALEAIQKAKDFDKTFVKSMAEDGYTKTEAKGIIAKLKAFFEKLKNSFRKINTNTDTKRADSSKMITAEGMAISEDMEMVDRLLEMFTRGMTEVRDNYEAYQRGEFEGVSDSVKAQRLGSAEDENEIIDLSKDNTLAAIVGDKHGSERYKIIANYILDELKNQPIIMSDGKRAVVDKRDSMHISRNAGDKKIAEISHIKEIIEIAKLVAYEESTKDRKYDYFWYYESNVKYKKDTFPVYVNLGRAKNDGSYHIYDLTQELRDTAHRVNDVGRPVGNALKNGVSKKIITNPDGSVKKNSSTFSQHLKVGDTVRYFVDTDDNGNPTYTSLKVTALKSDGFETDAGTFLSYDEEGNMWHKSNLKVNDTVRKNDKKSTFSQHLTTAEQEQKLAAEVKELKAENEALKKLDEKRWKMIDYLQKQLDQWRRGGKKLDYTAIEKLAGRLISENSSKLDRKELAKDLTSLFNYMADTKNPSAEVLKNRIYDVASRIVNSASAVNHEVVEQQKNIRRLLSKGVKFNEHQKGDAIHRFGSMAEYKAIVGSSVKVTEKGVPLDNVWSELSDMYPHLFPEDTVDADQPIVIADVLEMLGRHRTYNPFAEQYAGDMNLAVGDVITKIIEGYHSIPGLVDAQSAYKTAYTEARDYYNIERDRLINRLKESREWYKNYYKTWYQGRANALAYENAQKFKEYRDNRALTEEKNRVKKIMKTLATTLAEPTKSRYAPVDVFKAVVDICEAIDLGNNLDTKLGQRMAHLQRKYLEMLDNNEILEDYKSEFSERIYKNLNAIANSLGDRSISELSYKEMYQLRTALEDVTNTLVDARKQIGIDEFVENYDLAMQMIKELDEAPKNSKLAKMIAGASLTPMNVAEMISGYNRDSVIMQLFNRLRQGERDRKQYYMEAHKPFDKLMSEKEYKEFITKEYDVGIYDTKGHRVMLTKAEMAQIIMSWEREQTSIHLNHLNEGGVKIPDLKLLQKGRIAEALNNSKYIRNITLFDIGNMRDKMDAYSKRWMAVSREYFNGMSRKAVNDVSMKLLHRIAATAGDYIPFEVDDNFRVTELKGLSYNKLLENAGILKSITPGARQPLVIMGLNICVDRNIDTMAKLKGLAIPLRDVQKVYQTIGVKDDRGISVKDAIRDKGWNGIGTPDKDSNLFEQVMTELQAGRPAGEQSEWYNRLKGNQIKAILSYKISAALKNMTAYTIAGSKLSTKSLAAGIPNTVKRYGNMQALFDEIDKYTPLHYVRREGLSTPELAEMANVKMTKGKAFRGENWIKGMDVLVTASLWEACKVEISTKINKGEIKNCTIGTDAYFGRVANLYNEVIEETQQNNDILFKSEMQRSKSFVLQQATLFKTDMFVNYNTLYSSAARLNATNKMVKNATTDAERAKAQRLKKQAKANFSKAVASQLFGNLVLTVMTFVGNGLLRHKLDKYRDEEGDVSAEGILWEMFRIYMGTAAETITAPVSAFFDWYGWLESKITGEKFYENEDLVSSVVSDLSNGTTKLWNELKPLFDNDEETEGNVKEIAGNAIDVLADTAGLFGIPASNIKDMIQAAGLYTQDWFTDKKTFDSGYEFSNKEKLSKTVELVKEEKFKDAKTYVSDWINDKALELAEKDGLTEKDFKDNYNKNLYTKKAKSTLRGLFKERYKEDYLDAVENNDVKSVKDIRVILYNTWLYESNGKNDIDVVFTEWRKEDFEKEYKEAYKTAIGTGDTKTAAQIESKVKASGFYKKPTDTLKNWRKSAEETRDSDN